MNTLQINIFRCKKIVAITLYLRNVTRSFFRKKNVYAEVPQNHDNVQIQEQTQKFKLINNTFKKNSVLKLLKKIK